jgi:hypothetical protein
MRHPSYNLKVNKEADRAVMIETIRRTIPVFGNESEYRYIGFGGPFLEDMKRVHRAFPGIKLVSLEGNKETFKRQEFHRFVNEDQLTLIPEKSHEYIRTMYDPSGKEIIWLDHLNFGREELTDLVYLATKVATGSMLRITVRGEWKDKLPGAIAPADEWIRVYKSFRDNFGDLAPNELAPDDFLDGMRYCSIITQIVVAAVQDELSSPLPRYFQPLVANFYKDETRMLSVMGVVAETPNDDCTEVIGTVTVDSSIARAFNDWDLASLNGETVHQLDVPSLSLKERLVLDRHLPLTTKEREEACLNELPYLVGRTVDDHERLMLRYAALSPYYSQFARVEW